MRILSRKYNPNTRLLTLEVKNRKRIETRQFYCTRLESPDGVAVRLEKVGSFGDLDENHYNVLIEKEQNFCDCKGFMTYEKCYHTEVIRAMVAKKLI